MAENNCIPEVWTPELWHPDSKTGKIRRHRLASGKNLSDGSTTTITTALEQPSYSLPSSSFIPVSETDIGTEENIPDTDF